MPEPVSEFSYCEVGVEGLAEIQPLWTKLNAEHAAMSRPFGAEIAERTFASRRTELLMKGRSGGLWVEVVRAVASDGAAAVAYCLCTLSPEGVGEIDSIFVEEKFRGHGIGAELMRRALAWMEEMKAGAKMVSVLYENTEAIAFYRRFGFHPRTVLLLESMAPEGKAQG